MFRSLLFAIVVLFSLAHPVASQTIEQGGADTNSGFGYPEISPRDRCNECIQPCETRPVTRWKLPGFWGRPHVDPIVGECACGKRTGVTRHASGSIFWARPFSGHVDAACPGMSSWLQNCAAPALTSPFDRLGGFRGLPYHRTDNGFCGPGRDPYGCLGESNPCNATPALVQPMQGAQADNNFLWR